ncbi:TlpA family protein disulfide reductase [Fodinicola feengrottensis]|uniref:Thioredoxin domain-containing protein n=1 Tax=Fodinicola feengrottensis TaxID=435914 RepID=A0ABP4V991_9ACTN|nr:TlpA disulfide reductase family protein [Fodinicola feengrottensis]
MITRRQLIAAGAVSVAAAGLAGCAGGASGDGASRGGLGARSLGAGTLQTFAVGRRKLAGALSGDLLDGSRFDPAALTGEVVVVNFWGSWCAPCRKEAPDLEAAWLATKQLGVVFLGVDLRDTRDKARAFAGSYRISYPSLFDPAGRTALAFRDVPPSVVPATVVIDRSYRIAAVYRRVIQRAELEATVRAVAAGA